MNVFVYGTLTDPDRTGAVLDSFAYRGSAVLAGCHRVDGRHPTLAPGGTTTGRLLTTDEVEALDRYEGVASGLYVRVSVPVVGAGDAPAGTGGDEEAPTHAAVYVGDPGRLGAEVDWPGEGTFAERVRSYVERADVAIVRDDETATPGEGRSFADFEGSDGDDSTDATTDHDDWGVE